VWQLPDYEEVVTVRIWRAAASVGLVAALAVATWLIGCTTQSSIQPPPDTGASVRAYVGAAVCQTCHRSEHASWTTTKHSVALSVLQQAGQAENERCLPCHTVGYGEETGYTNQADTPQLANVQCENCHGAGGRHIANPSQNQMNIPLNADLCGQCHTGSHHPNFDQWAESKHAAALTTLQENPHASDACLDCHSVEARLASGEHVVLALPEQVETVVAQNPITCQLCHAAHGSPNPAQLRQAPTELCVQCHTDDDSSPPSSPHHPQREIFLGLGGWEPNGAQAIGPNSAHTTAAALACITCHVYQTAPDQPTDENPVNTGHTFLPRVPDACTQCHEADEAIALMTAAQDEIDTRVAQLTRYFTQDDSLFIDRTTLGADDQARFDIAKFNVQLVSGDGSSGVHNLAYCRDLLNISETIFTSL